MVQTLSGGLVSSDEGLWSHHCSAVLRMVTPLERPIRRLIQIDDKAFVVTLTPTGVRLVLKGRRKGVGVTWRQILDGEVGLHAQLAESLAQHAPSSTSASSGRPRGDRG